MEKTTIKLFLVDGDPNGIIKCTFSSGWEKCAYKIPESDLNKCDNIQVLQNAGIYFLFGYDENENDIVYIGQGNVRQNGNGVLGRIKEPHDQIKDWKTCVIFTSLDGVSIGPTELNYLEHEFTKLAKDAGRYIVKNGNMPNPAKLSEEDEADMQLFLNKSRIILNTLGYKVLEPVVSKKVNKNSDDIYYYSFNGLKAKGIKTDDGFVLLNGSQLRNVSEAAEGLKDRIVELRQKFSNIIKNNVTEKDILFKSPSGAASFCSGQFVSGPKAWKDENDNSLEKNSKTNK